VLRSLKQPLSKVGRLARLLPVSDRQWANLDLLRTLVQRDLRVRYEGSMIGNLWAVVHQVLQLLIFTYVFSVVLQVKLSLKGLPANDFTYGLWLFAGLVPWTALVLGLSQAATSVINQPNLVKKVVFPLSLLPLVPILSAFVESSIGLMLLIAMLAFTTKTLHASLLLLPLVWIPQLLLTAGLGYLTAGLTVFIRDIAQTVGVVLNLWFYVTPIIYPANIVPEFLKFWVFQVNPFTAIVETYRDLILEGKLAHGPELLTAYGVAIAVFFLGWLIYKRLRPAFADVL